MTTFVIAKDGTKLMPTTNVKKVRKLLRSGRARIYRLDPFTIQLKYESGHETQPIEIAEDTGGQHVGVSLKSQKHEFVSEQYDMLDDEKDRHDTKRKYRRERRSRKRYRKPRFDNRKKPEGWIAPSIKNKADRQIDIIRKYTDICPITSITVEVGSFDTQVLEDLEKTGSVSEDLDYQHGPKYGFDTLREAVFFRDGYKCVCCGASGIPKDRKPGIMLHVHHLGYLKHDHSDRMGNLVTVCSDCHTPANHASGGKLYGLEPEIKPLKGAAFMNTVRWYIYNTLKDRFPDIVHMTYGSVTKRTRLNCNIEKSHVNDAYCMGDFRPKHRTRMRKFKKVRRHNRVLSKFYDARYVDKRDGSIKKGTELSNGRTNRSHKRDTENLRKYRGEKVEAGYTTIRTSQQTYRQGDVIAYKGKRYVCYGMKNGGTAVKLVNRERIVNPSVNSVMLVRRGNGWKELFDQHKIA